MRYICITKANKMRTLAIKKAIANNEAESFITYLQTATLYSVKFYLSHS